uniref:Uncharacterized protein n=1 Tax=viral metagenome TaxID=1070528 RepID=A0A6C0EG94_9ZZZZ
MSLALYASPYDNNGIDNSTDNLISKKRLAHHNKTQKYYNRDNGNNQSDKVKNIMKKIHDNSMYNDSIDGVEMGDFSPLSPPESSGVNRTIDKSSFKENYTGISIDNDNDFDNYNSSKNSSVNALTSSDNSNYYTIPSDNNSKSSMQPNQPNKQPQSTQSTQSNQPNQANQPTASNYLDSIEYNNLNNNYGDNKSVEEYYKKFSPNYSYGTVSNWNRTAQTQAQSNANNINKKIYANADSTINSPFLPSLMSSSSPTNTENSILIEKLNYMIHLLEEQQDERTNNVTEEVILYCFLGVFMIFIVDSFTRVGKYVR